MTLKSICRGFRTVRRPQPPSKVTRHYVTFYYPGFICADKNRVEVDHRDPLKITVPPRAYAFQFSDQTEFALDGEVLKGEVTNPSKTFYPGGRVKTYDQIEADGTGTETLLTNMRVNDWKYVVQTVSGWAQPFDPEQDAILPVAAAVTP